VLPGEVNPLAVFDCRDSADGDFNVLADQSRELDETEWTCSGSRFPQQDCLSVASHGKSKTASG